MRRARFALLAVLLPAAGTRLGAQAVVPEHAQEAGATDWFGERILKIKGGSRVEVEPHVAGHFALFKVTPIELRFIRMDTLPATKSRFNVEQDSVASQVRVPFTVTAVSAGNARPMVPVPSRAPPPPVRHVRDGILIIVTDLALDSAELMARLARLPAVPPDSLADHAGQLLVGRRTAMWAAYYEAR